MNVNEPDLDPIEVDVVNIERTEQPEYDKQFDSDDSTTPTQCSTTDELIKAMVNNDKAIYVDYELIDFVMNSNGICGHISDDGNITYMSFEESSYEHSKPWYIRLIDRIKTLFSPR